MRFRISGRGAGKTYDCVQAIKDNPEGILVVFSEAERERIVRLYDLPPSVAMRIVSFQRPAHALRGISGPLYIDNLDIILQQVFPGFDIRMVAASGTTEDG